MRTAYLVTVILVALALETQGQPELFAPYVAASRSAHETVWQGVDWETNEVGQAIAHTNAFVELATGLNFFDESTQQFQPSREEWVVYPDAIVAQAGRHKVILAHNLNLGGSVDVLLPSENGLPPVRLISNPVGLGWYDPVDGKHALLAEIRDCAPQRGAGLNEIVFRDCFDGIRGSIRFLFTKAGVHQHVVLEQRLTLPDEFSDKTRLEVYTEFASGTVMPRMTPRVLRREKDPVLRALMVEPDFTDSELEFGSMAMRMGKAFALSAEEDTDSIRVGKRFETISGRPVLTESVEFKELEPLLAGLASVERPNSGEFAINSSRQIPHANQPARLPRADLQAMSEGNEIQLASHPLREPAVVIDYELVSSGSNFTFKGGTTYFVSGSVNLSGTTKIEGTVVVKVTNSPTAKINVTGAIDCQTGPYRPAIFTSQYDTTVGEAIGSGALTNYPGALVINTSGNALHDLRFSYATSAVALGFSPGAIQLTNVQFVQCQYPIDSTACDLNEIIVHNGLICRAKFAIKGGRDLSVNAQHVTAHRCEEFAWSPSGSDSSAVMINCLLVGVTNWGSEFTFTPAATTYYATDVGGIFQTVGAGSHYLVNESTNRDSGISPSFLLQPMLTNKTTYPPVELTTNFTANTTLVPQAARDTTNWDRGYHFDAIDFVVSGRTVSANLTLTNGVALGVYGTSSSYGLGLSSGSLVSEGQPNALNWIVRYNTVQEQSTTNWSASSAGPSVKKLASSPTVRARFTGWSVPAGVNDHFNDTTVSTTVGAFTDCQFSGGKFTAYPGSVALTNSLWQRVYLTLRDDAEDMQWYLFNNTFYGGTLLYKAVASSPVLLAYDNLFDQTIITKLSGSEYFTHDYNAYLTNQNRLNPNGTNDLILTTLLYGPGPLGNFYPSPYPLLENIGSRDAYTAGLFHYTTTSSQVMETNSIVDIGFHYLVITNGLPLDADADGIPDYADSDSDGNDGLPDSWEQRYIGHLTETPSGDYDGDCLTNLFEYQQGTNPADQPSVTSAPVYQIVPTNVNVTFTVAGSPGCVKYQWYKDGAAITGATNTSLTLTAVQLTSNALYKANVFSGAGVTSAAARLVALDGPAWTIWTNYLAQTNGKNTTLFTTQPPYSNPPVLTWNTNCLLYGKTGFTAKSPWNSYGGGQRSVTALTKRHGYTAGHPLSPNPNPPYYYVGFGGHVGEKVWFCDSNNTVIPMTITNSWVRYTNMFSTNLIDYAIFTFTEDLTNTITPMAVMQAPNSIGVCFATCQHGNSSANQRPPRGSFSFADTSKPPFNEHDTYQGGDSGSPNMIPTTGGSLVFIGGSTSSGPSTNMQADMDALTLSLNLSTNDYRLNWHTNYP